MSAHAPGPWHIDAQGYIRTDVHSDRGSGVAVARVVLRAEWGPSTYDANARLIAFAPEMAVILAKVLDDRCEEHEAACCYEWCKYCQAQIKTDELARALLAKLEADHE